MTQQLTTNEYRFSAEATAQEEGRSVIVIGAFTTSKTFGGERRHNYICLLKDSQSGTWSLKSLSIDCA